jgi:hypothetical protein
MARPNPPFMPPLVAAGDDDSLRRLQFRLWQVFITTLTVLITVWFITLGPVPAIIALAVAKHVLVAILVMGLDIYPQYKGEKELRQTGG